MFKGNRGAKNCLKFLVFVIFHKCCSLLNFTSNSNHNLCCAAPFFASTALMVTFEESQVQTISDISLFSDARLCGKIKFERLQTKRTIAEKLGTGKTTDSVHSTVLRKNYRLVLNQFKFKFQI